jgi:hypothetical protein
MIRQSAIQLHGNGKVGVLMGSTENSYGVFSGVQNFHWKVFYNRLDYANHQGTRSLGG